MKTLYRTILLIVSFLLLALPQVNISDYANATISSKCIIFSYGCLIILSIYSISISFCKNKFIQLSKLDISLLLLFFYIVINRYFIQANAGFSLRYIELLGLGVLYIILRTFSVKSYIYLFLIIVISGFVQAFYGNLQLFNFFPSNHSGFKMTGSFFNSGPYAGFLAAVWVLSLGMYLFKEEIKELGQLQDDYSYKLVNKLLVNLFEYVPLIGIISIALVIPAIHSRGAWLAVITGGALMAEFRYHYIKRLLIKSTNIKKTILIVSAILVIGTSLFGIYHFKKGSADGRLFIWKVTTEMIKDTAVLGVGFDRFKAHYMDYQADYFAKHGETDEALVADNSYYAFNDWLQYVAENGLIGFLLLSLVLHKVFFIKTSGQNKYLLFIVKSTMLCIGTFALVSYPMQILPIKLVLVVMLALLSSLDKKKYAVMPTKIQEKPGLVRGFKMVILVMAFTVIFKVYPKLTALDKDFKTWQTALTAYQYGDYDNAIKNYEEAYPLFKRNGDFLMNYGKALSMANQNEKAVEILKEAKEHLNTTIIETALGDAYKGTKEYNKAETAYQHAANMIPIRFYPLYLQVKLYEECGDKEKALIMAKTILNKDIKIPSTAIKEIKAEMRKIINREE